LFQMSGSDSSNLIDTPAAARLGLHRALYFTEEKGQPEKFRPYGLPETEWLEWLKSRFAAKEPVKVPPAPWPEPRTEEPVGGPPQGPEAG